MEIREKAVQVLKLMEGPGAENGKVTGWDSPISQRKIQCYNREVWRTLITVEFILCPVLE